MIEIPQSRSLAVASVVSAALAESGTYCVCPSGFGQINLGPALSIPSRSATGGNEIRKTITIDVTNGWRSQYVAVIRHRKCAVAIAQQNDAVGRIIAVAIKSVECDVRFAVGVEVGNLQPGRDGRRLNEHFGPYRFVSKCAVAVTQIDIYAARLICPVPPSDRNVELAITIEVGDCDGSGFQPRHQIGCKGHAL